MILLRDSVQNRYLVMGVFTSIQMRIGVHSNTFNCSQWVRKLSGFIAIFCEKREVINKKLNKKELLG